MDVRDRVGIPWIVYVAIGILIMFLLMSFPIGYSYEEEQVEILDAQCPFGHMWVDLSGNFLSFDSTLTESYIIKYVTEDNQVRTVIFDSSTAGKCPMLGSDINYGYDVVLMNNLTMPYMTIQYEKPRTVLGNGWDEYISWYTLYIPDPRLIQCDASVENR